jgi:hypothetical protein
MSFTIYTQDGTKFQQWFPSIDELLASMVKNSKDVYHRNA